MRRIIPSIFLPSRADFSLPRTCFSAVLTCKSARASSLACVSLARKKPPVDVTAKLFAGGLHPNKRKTGVCWEPRNRRCHRLGDDFVGCLLPPRWGPTTLSQTRETLRSKAQPIAAAVTSARHRLAWGRNLGRLRNQAVDEHYSRHLVDVKSRIPHIVILPPIART